MSTLRARIDLNRSMTHLLLGLSSILVIFPFFWMVATSLKGAQEIIQVPPTLVPHTLNLAYYRELLSSSVFLRYFLNSIIVSTIGTVVSTFGSLIAGFVFAKFTFKGDRFLFFLVLATLMVPFQCYLIPLYVASVSLKLVNTYVGLTFPIIVSSFGVFFLRQNIESIPDELLEAARMDGASIWRVFFLIVTPLSVSATVVLAIFQFMNAWGNFLWPLVITNSRDMFVLELGLSQFRGEFQDDYGRMMTGATLGILPVILVFLVFRRYVIEGITLSGLKA